MVCASMVESHLIKPRGFIYWSFLVVSPPFSALFTFTSDDGVISFFYLLSSPYPSAILFIYILRTDISSLSQLFFFCCCYTSDVCWRYWEPFSFSCLHLLLYLHLTQSAIIIAAIEAPWHRITGCHRLYSSETPSWLGMKP